MDSALNIVDIIIYIDTFIIDIRYYLFIIELGIVVVRNFKIVLVSYY